MRSIFIDYCLAEANKVQNYYSSVSPRSCFRANVTNRNKCTTFPDLFLSFSFLTPENAISLDSITTRYQQLNLLFIAALNLFAFRWLRAECVCVIFRHIPFISKRNSDEKQWESINSWRRSSYNKQQLLPSASTPSPTPNLEQIFSQLNEYQTKSFARTGVGSFESVAMREASRERLLFWEKSYFWIYINIDISKMTFDT